MDCFNYIRIAGGCYDEAAPDGFRDLSDIEGLSLANVAAITPADAMSATNLVRRKAKTAARLLDSAVRAKLLDLRINLSKKTPVAAFCKFGEGYVSAAAGSGLKLSYEWIESPFVSLYIGDLKIKTATSSPTTITISDKYGATLFAVDVTTAAGSALIVPVNKSFKQKTLYITSSAALEMANVARCASRDCFVPSTVVASGIAGGVSVNDPIGFVVCAALRCSPKNIACHFIECLGDALLYLTAAEVAKEIAAPSSRFNCFASSSKEWAAEMVPVWTDIADTFINNEIGGIAEELRSDFCYQCAGGGFRSVPILPG